MYIISTVTVRLQICEHITKNIYGEMCCGSVCSAEKVILEQESQDLSETLGDVLLFKQRRKEK